jgi:hypothetical protein
MRSLGPPAHLALRPAWQPGLRLGREECKDPFHEPARTAAAECSDRRRGAGPKIPGETWLGLVAPAGTPAEIVSRLHRDATRALQQPELRATYARFGWRLIPESSPAEFAAALEEDARQWSAIFRTAGVKLP